jgi:lauroyl/myristoyl acyltransferase
LRLSRLLPAAYGLRLVDFLADRVARRRDTALVRAMRCNQWVISGHTLDSRQLDAATQASLRSLARSFYWLFRYYDDQASLLKLVDLDNLVQEVNKFGRGGQRGAVACGVHLCGFDLTIMAAGHRGLRMAVLSLPDEVDTHEAVEWQHSIRRLSGLEILPASLSNLRSLVQRLRDGELVVTGIDRPIPSPRQHPVFFGCPSDLPVHHIYLAMMADVPVVVLAPQWGSDGVIRLLVSEYIEMEHSRDRQADILRNAERVLQVAAGFIRQTPEQWVVNRPLWPEAIALMPK